MPTSKREYASLVLAATATEDEDTLAISATATEEEGDLDLERAKIFRGDNNSSSSMTVRATLESENYCEATIRAEFKTYHSILPDPDKLLQEHHSVDLLRATFEESGKKLPRFLRGKTDGGIKPHHALCCMLLSQHHKAANEYKQTCQSYIYPLLVKILTCGCLHPQLNNPSHFIRDQFDRVVHAIPVEAVEPHVLRRKIRNRGLPVPNYFLDPEDPRQFPPHIALLVILQEGEKESKKFSNVLYQLAFSLFAFVALILRIVLEVIGGAGAIWGGAEVVTLRTAENVELWRWISVAFGVLCFCRFITLNAPQSGDEGDILGPAGPWSLTTPGRLRAVCDHPLHYFVRALPPFSSREKHD